jgi:hypothetical protein
MTSLQGKVVLLLDGLWLLMLFLDIDVTESITRSLIFYKDSSLLIEILTVFNMIYIFSFIMVGMIALT